MGRKKEPMIFGSHASALIKKIKKDSKRADRAIKSDLRIGKTKKKKGKIIRVWD